MPWAGQSSIVQGPFTREAGSGECEGKPYCRPSGHRATLTYLASKGSPKRLPQIKAPCSDHRHTETSATGPLPAGPLFQPAKWRRAEVLRWLRRTHAWCGLWAAYWACCSAPPASCPTTGAVMKLPLAQTTPVRDDHPDRRTAFSLAVSHADVAGRKPGSPPGSIFRMERQAARPVSWGAGTLQQPERWEFNLRGPKAASRLNTGWATALWLETQRWQRVLHPLTLAHGQGVHPV